MPNFNYGKPRGSPTALSLLIAPVSKLCRLHVEQRGGECPTMCVWEFIFCVSLRAAFLKCFVPLPVITKRGCFFFCQAFSGGWSSTAARMAKKEMKKKKKSPQRLATSEMPSAEMHLVIVKQPQWRQYYLRSMEYNEWLIQYRRWDPMGEGGGEREPGDEKTGK